MLGTFLFQPGFKPELKLIQLLSSQNRFNGENFIFTLLLRFTQPSPDGSVVETVSNEKGVSREAIFEALEQALVAATKKKFYEGTNSEEARLRVEIDRKTGDYRTFRQWEVVADEDHEMPACQDAISDVDPAQWSIGDIRELEVESIDFGRIAAQIAKQVS